MMLVLLPYYKSSRVDLRQQEANTEELLKQLDKLREQAKDSPLAKELNDMIEKLQQQIKQLQGQLNQLTAENDQLKAQNQELQNDNIVLRAKNQSQADELESRQPFLTTVVVYPAQHIDLYIQSDGVSENKRTNPPFDPAKPRHDPFFNGDLTSYADDHGVSVWMKRDAPADTHFKIYVKLAPEGRGRIIGQISGADWDVQLPVVILTPPRFWTLLGTATTNKGGKLTFVAATDAERDAEWTKLSKGTPPPSAAPSNPAGGKKSPEETKKDMERMDAERERFRRIREQQQQSGSPAPQASPSTANRPPLSEEQRRSIRERYLKEHAMPSPGPAATSSP